MFLKTKLNIKSYIVQLIFVIKYPNKMQPLQGICSFKYRMHALCNYNLCALLKSSVHLLIEQLALLDIHLYTSSCRTTPDIPFTLCTINLSELI